MSIQAVREQPERKINILFFVLLYLGIRLLSFLTYSLPFLNSFIAALLIIGFGFVAIKKLPGAWIILLIELLLDGSGHFFELHGLILRTWFLAVFGCIWVFQKVRTRKIELPFPNYFKLSLIAVAVVILWAVINGLLKHHGVTPVLQDAILYGFLLLLFPAIEFHTSAKKWYPLIIKAYLIGSALFSLITLFIYSSGLGRLPDTYYHWFRNIAGGKITDLGNHFFRIVLSEHLFIVPILLVLTSHLIANPKNKRVWGYIVASSIILTLNFSRIYFVGLAGGLIILAFRESFKKWFIASTLVSMSILAVFCSLYFISSRGNSLGLELWGLRISGTVSPADETSGAIRLAILPDAIRTIKKHPWLGSGLGTTVTYTDPTSHELVTRTQFDWGYLEVIAELGIIGTTIFLFFLLSVIYVAAKRAYSRKDNTKNLPLLRGLIAGAMALFVMNITTPALFQGFGILYFVFLLVLSYQGLSSNYYPRESQIVSAES